MRFSCDPNSPVYETLKRIHYYIEDNTPVELAAKAVYLFFGFVAALLTIAEIFLRLPAIAVVLTVLLLLGLLLGVLAADTGHMYMLHRRRQEILRRDRHISNMKDFISHFERHVWADIKLRKRHVYMDIDEHGNVAYRRLAIIEARDGRAFCYRFIIGTAGASTEAPVSIEELKLVIKDANDGRPLLWIVTEDRPEHKKFLLILDPAPRAGETCSVLTTLNWPGAWKPLVTDYRDAGALTILEDTDELLMQLTLPPHLEFTGFAMASNPGQAVIKELDNGRSTMEFRAEDLRAGDRFPYQVTCCKRRVS